MTSGRGERHALCRAGALATLSALLTAVGHLAGGGTLPDVGVLLVLLPLLAGGFVQVASKCRGAVGTTATLAAGQLALHALMVQLHPPHDAGPAAPDGATMPVLHIGVTLATAVALNHADRAVAGLLTALQRLVPRRLTFRAAGQWPSIRAGCSLEPSPLTARSPGTAHPRRGPPVGC